MGDLVNDFNFGIEWNDIRMYYCDGEKPKMSGYHMHSYYEISLLMKGNMTVFFSDNFADREEDARVVLMKPFTPHYIIPKNGTYFRHCNIEFSAEFAESAFCAFPELAAVFTQGGNIIHIDEKNCENLISVAEKISCETSITKKKLLLLQFLFELSDKAQENKTKLSVPEYITEALRYIGKNYAKKEDAGKIAEKVGVSRTTLMTNFKKHTGVTVNEYIIRCRINHAIPKLNMRESEENIALSCGFGSVSNMIHSFKKVYGTTPQKYIKSFSEK